MSAASDTDAPPGAGLALAARVAALDWRGVAEELDARGCSVLERLLTLR